MDEQPGADANAAPAVDDYGFPTAGEMSTEDMSDEQLDAFVDSTLGLSKAKGGTPNAKTETPTPEPTPPAPAVEEPVPTPAAPEAPPAPVEPQTAPELVTDDLWVEVTNAEGAKIKLSLDDGIPDEFTFASDKQLYEILDAFQEMKNLKKERETAIQDWNAKQEAEATQAQSQEDTLNGWNQEISDLIDAGVLEGPKVKENDPNYLKDPAVAKIDEVFKFMTAENAKRATSGKPPLRSFGVAYNLYSNDSNIKAVTAAEAAQAAATKQRGAIVGGTSAPTGNTDRPVYKRGSASNIWKVDTSDI